jgi:hypothetical protein
METQQDLILLEETQQDKWDKPQDKQLAQFLQVTQGQFNDVREYLLESPQTVKVVKRITSIYDEKQNTKLKTSKESIDIYRAQGALDILKNIDNMIENIKGNY